MAEAKRLRLDAVHQDHPHARERIVVQLAVRGTRHLTPGEHLAIERHPFFGENIQAHGHLRAAKVGPRRATATGCVALGDDHGQPHYRLIETRRVHERVGRERTRMGVRWSAKFYRLGFSYWGYFVSLSENRKRCWAVLGCVAALVLLGCTGGAERCDDCPVVGAGGRIFSTSGGGAGAAGMKGGGGFAGTFTGSGAAGTAGTTASGGQAGTSAGGGAGHAAG